MIQKSFSGANIHWILDEYKLARSARQDNPHENPKLVLKLKKL